MIIYNGWGSGVGAALGDGVDVYKTGQAQSAAHTSPRSVRVNRSKPIDSTSAALPKLTLENRRFLIGLGVKLRRQSKK